MKKAVVIILIALAVLGILVYVGLSHVFLPISRKDLGNGFSGEIRAILFQRGQVKMALYYRGHEICSDVSDIRDQPYELSPDNRYALFINSEKVEDRHMHRYEVYDLISREKIIFPETLEYPSNEILLKWDKTKVFLQDEDVKLELDLIRRTIQTSSNLYVVAKLLKVNRDGTLDIELPNQIKNEKLAFTRKLLHKLNDSTLDNSDKVKMIGVRSLGSETANALNKMLRAGDIILLEFFGRKGDADEQVLLAYVYDAKGRMINEELLRSGKADLLEDEDNTIHKEQLKKAYAAGKK